MSQFETIMDSILLLLEPLKTDVALTAQNRPKLIQDYPGVAIQDVEAGAKLAKFAKPCLIVTDFLETSSTLLAAIGTQECRINSDLSFSCVFISDSQKEWRERMRDVHWPFRDALIRRLGGIQIVPAAWPTGTAMPANVYRGMRTFSIDPETSAVEYSFTLKIIFDVRAT